MRIKGEWNSTVYQWSCYLDGISGGGVDTAASIESDRSCQLLHDLVNRHSIVLGDVNTTQHNKAKQMLSQTFTIFLRLYSFSPPPSYRQWSDAQHGAKQLVFWQWMDRLQVRC